MSELGVLEETHLTFRLAPEMELECETNWSDERYQLEGTWWDPTNWDGNIKAAANMIGDFFEGLFAGLGDQVKDLIELITDPLVLIDIGKEFAKDPIGFLEKILVVLVIMVVIY